MSHQHLAAQLMKAGIFPTLQGFALLKTFFTHISPVLKCKWLKYNQSTECAVIGKKKLLQSA